MKKETQLALAKAIQSGIDRYHASIKDNSNKEANGTSKLQKSFDGDAPAAGTDFGGGDAMQSIPMGKGVLPAAGAGGVGGAMDGGNNLDAGFVKDEMEDAPSCPACGGNRVEPLGVLGKLVHSLCRNCGIMSSHPVEENTEAKENSDPTVAKGEWTNDYSKGRPTKNGKLVPDTSKHPSAAELLMEPDPKVLHPSDKKMKKEELGKATPPGEEKLVHKLKGEYGSDKAGKEKAYATAWAIHNKKMKKEELEPKKVPMTATVVAEPVKGSKDGTEGKAKTIDTDGSGDISKGKSLGKGAMVEHIKAKAAAAGVKPSAVGIRPPKTLPAVKPAPSPAFIKDEGGFAREKAIKEGKVAPTPVTSANISAGVIPRVNAGVQSQIAAVKKPLIPMVNASGPVAKAEWKPKRPGEERWMDVNKPSGQKGSFPFTSYGRKEKDIKAAAAKNKVAESKAQEVEKTESPASKPVAKSPASAPAAKAPAVKPAQVAKPKAPRL